MRLQNFSGTLLPLFPTERNIQQTILGQDGAEPSQKAARGTYLRLGIIKTMLVLQICILGVGYL